MAAKLAQRCAETATQRLFLSAPLKGAFYDWGQIVGGSGEANQSCGCAETNGKMRRFANCKLAASTTNCNNNNNRRVFYCCLLVLLGQFIVIESGGASRSDQSEGKAARVISVKVGKFLESNQKRPKSGGSLSLSLSVHIS